MGRLSEYIARRNQPAAAGGTLSHYDEPLRFTPVPVTNKQRIAVELAKWLPKLYAMTEGTIEYKALAKRVDRLTDALEGKGWGKVLRLHLQGKGYDEYESQDRPSGNTSFDGLNAGCEIRCEA